MVKLQGENSNITSTGNGITSAVCVNHEVFERGYSPVDWDVVAAGLSVFIDTVDAMELVRFTWDITAKEFAVPLQLY
jgi:hypothetical protein